MQQHNNLKSFEAEARALYAKFQKSGFQDFLKTKLQGFVPTRWTSRIKLFISIEKNIKDIIQILTKYDPDSIENFKRIFDIEHGLSNTLNHIEQILRIYLELT